MDLASEGVPGVYAWCLAIHKTWLPALGLDMSLGPTFMCLPTFMCRQDSKSGKRKGGGLAVFVNDRWCNPGHVTIK